MLDEGGGSAAATGQHMQRLVSQRGEGRGGEIELVVDGCMYRQVYKKSTANVDTSHFRIELGSWSSNEMLAVSLVYHQPPFTRIGICCMVR